MNWVFSISFNPLSDFDVDDMIVFMSILHFVAFLMHSGRFYQFFVRWIHNSHCKAEFGQVGIFFEDRFPSLRNFVNKKVGNGQKLRLPSN